MQISGALRRLVTVTPKPTSRGTMRTNQPAELAHRQGKVGSRSLSSLSCASILPTAVRGSAGLQRQTHTLPTPSHTPGPWLPSEARTRAYVHTHKNTGMQYAHTHMHARTNAYTHICTHIHGAHTSTHMPARTYAQTHNAFTCAHIHMCTHEYVHACKHMHTHTWMHRCTHMHACTYAQTHNSGTYAHTSTHTHVHTQVRICTHTQAHTHGCTHTHTCTHTYPHTHACTHTSMFTRTHKHMHTHHGGTLCRCLQAYYSPRTKAGWWLKR